MSEEMAMEPQGSSMRRTLTARSNVARQVAVNFMPSRQLHYNTVRLRRSNPDSAALLDALACDADAPDGQANIIVREMEQHERLMDDDPAAEELRREALRDLPQGLTTKRSVRAKLSASVSLRSKRRPISVFKRFKYRVSFAWKRSKDRFRDFVFSIELWYEAIRVIEGQYGSAVGSYFYFLRWLFCLNVMMTCVVLAFVVAPQALHDEGRNSTGQWGFLYFVSGKGGYEDSLLFYGHYHDGDISPRGPRYNMPFAYFFTMVCVYLTAFAVLCYRTAYSYRRNFILTAGGGAGAGAGAALAARLFSGWDFGIVSPRAAALTAATIHNELKELLSEQNKSLEAISRWTRAFQYLTNVVVTALVLAIIAGLEYGIWRFLRLEASARHWETIASLTVTGAVAALPVLFNFIVRMEYYSARTALWVTLCRTWLLDAGTLVVLLYFWARSQLTCWETSFGQEAYRLVLLDCLVSLLVLPAFEFIRSLAFKLYPDTVSAPTFNIGYNSLTLIYNQAVLWFGMLFSPLLVVAVTIKFLLLFYVKRVAALKACQPAGKIWRASQTQTVLYMLVTLSLFTTLFALGTLYFRAPSTECGPFVQYERVYHVLTEGVLGLSEHAALLAALLFLAKPGVIAFLGLFLCVAVYYLRAKARAQRSMVAILRHMLVLQAKDKDFLLNAIANVSNGEWLYNPRPDDGQGPSEYTWKYLNEVRKPSNAEFHFDPTRLNHSGGVWDQSKAGQSGVFHLDHSRMSHSMLERPKSHGKERPTSRVSDGETDSSFSWQGSNARLNDERGGKKWG